ncbi:tyrosine/dopa decarboxylase [Trifolium medium]|uniref:Tyrosine/dopa decarboxylase n=1 Tax=Trifolium medium TaxID=97028 RepID=A0A392NPN8_9FABA|nr:tyrosine/dopa decarboxylase [Trifolium medium]
MSQGVKEKLSNPLIAAQFELSNQILPIRAVSLPVYYYYYYHSFLSNSRYHEVFTTTTTTTTTTTITTTTLTATTATSTATITSTRKRDGYSSDSSVPLNLVDPKFSSSKSSSSGEYVKGPSIYMVTDDLVVSPISSFNAISHLNSLNVPLLDVEEKVVRIGPKEGLCILKASLTSTSALTNGLNQFIRTTIKEEK